MEDTDSEATGVQLHAFAPSTRADASLAALCEVN